MQRGFIPDQGTKIPQATKCSQKIKKKKKKTIKVTTEMEQQEVAECEEKKLRRWNCQV